MSLMPLLPQSRDLQDKITRDKALGTTVGNGVAKTLSILHYTVIMRVTHAYITITVFMHDDEGEEEVVGPLSDDLLGEDDEDANDVPVFKDEEEEMM